MSAHYQSYSESVESGVQWLGSIPKHWGIIQSRRLFGQRKERMRSGDEQLTASQKYGVIPQTEFMRLEDQTVMQVFVGADILKHVEPNDFVISMRSFQGGLEWCGHAGCVSSAYVGITPVKHVVSGFFKYLFKSSPYIQALQRTSNLVRDGQALRFQNFVQVSLPLVPEEEQAQIAKFLDYETAKIDVLIEMQQQLIALLKEKRQAVISHAVTKGLDPDAPMRDSGIEWLGEVPVHWKIKRLKYLGEAIIGLTYSPDHVVNEGEGTLVLRSSNVQQQQLVYEDNVYVSKQIPPDLKLRKGDILICSRNGSRALIGKNAQIDQSAAGLTFGAFMTVFRSDYNDYLLQVFNSPVFNYQSGTFLTSTINQLTVGNLRSFEVPFPPVDEQSQISTFLAGKTTKLDSLIGKAVELALGLQERRTALISAAVTGKIDVRDWKPSESETEAAVA